jgi:hypothetical protein
MQPAALHGGTQRSFTALGYPNVINRNEVGLYKLNPVYPYYKK